VTYTVVWLPEVMSAFRRLRAADHTGAKQVAAAVAALADQPAPGESTPLGRSGFRRLRLGDCRVLYEVDVVTAAVFVVNVGSVAEPGR
jgi:mRNA interferase RelE/StbE